VSEAHRCAPRRLRPRGHALAVLAVGAAAVAGYAAGVEPRRLVVRRLSLELPGWPQALAGLRVGVLTDMHGGVVHAGEQAIARWVARMNAEAPDVILLGGDFTDAHWLFGRRLAPERIAERLAELQAPLGRVAVLGNHDWKAFGMRTWTALAAAGIPVLENDAMAFDAPGGRFHVAGVADVRFRRPDVARALAPVPDGEPVLVLAHDPDVFPFVPSRVALTISGHTHGGQVAIPLLRLPFIPSRHGERFRGGHIVEHGRHLYVGAGLGTSGLPVRLFAPPELLVLELRPAAAAA
jgi:predicted MPP superfamily phosphohydrolase